MAPVTNDVSLKASALDHHRSSNTIYRDFTRASTRDPIALQSSHEGGVTLLVLLLILLLIGEIYQEFT